MLGNDGGALLAVLFSFLANRSQAAQTPATQAPVTAAQVIDEVEKNFGVHPGQRRNHTKGICAQGRFIGNRDMARYSRSALFSGKAVPVVARFSVAGGNPGVADTARNPRGMALEFRLPGGKLQHMTMINTPMFGAATPKTFFDNLIATRPDPQTGKPDPAKVKAFLQSHPDAVAQAEFLQENNPPPSWANSAYFGIHTFRFIDAAGKTTPVRWAFLPRDGEKRLSDEAMTTSARDFLGPALIQRLRKGPVRWEMQVSIGEPGDPVDDPSVQWPPGRQRIQAGVLTIKSATPRKGGACEPINYDPLVMADGIAPTDDPILNFRSPAYAVSFAKRRAGE